MTKPLNIPMPAPSKIHTNDKKIIQLGLLPMLTAKRLFVTQITPPTERSNPPLIRTTVCPIDTNMSENKASDLFAKNLILKVLGLIMAIMTVRIHKTTYGTRVIQCSFIKSAFLCF
jgi:hypothetical protein